MRRQSDEVGFGQYQILLVKLGFLSARATPSEAWFMWSLVAEDKEVLRRSKRRAGRNWSGTVSGYSDGAPILAAMSKKDLTALKERLGIRPVKELR